MEDVQAVADKLAKDAHDLGQDDEYMSPFATRAESFGLNFKGMSKLAMEFNPGYLAFGHIFHRF